MNPNNTHSRSPQITALTPKDDLKPDTDSEFWVYNEHLKNAFQNPNIRNVALSGSLGSGKSSIIRSFDRTRNGEKKHFLYVSLMDFSKATTDTCDKQYDQRELEYSLLNQILSHCTSRDLPEGSISGVPEKYPRLRFRSVLISLLSFAIFMLIFHDRFGALAGKLGTSENVQAWIHLILYVLVGGVLASGVYHVSRCCLPFFRLSKLTLKSNVAEAEVSLGKERTTLDAYKFELAYILERIGKKHDYTVVFEDLERLDSRVAVDIMGKLRELNILTNNHIQAVHAQNKDFFHSKKQIAIQPIRFVYAISDRTMPVEHRTKFYDCIIPVVPVSHPLNCQNHLKEILAEFNFGPDWEAKLCDALSDAFVDYRTCLTLQNEFSVLWWLYWEQLPKENAGKPFVPCNNATIFALAAYKVLFPEFFEYALSPLGDKILPDFNSVEQNEKLVEYLKCKNREDEEKEKLAEYIKRKNRKKSLDSIQKLFNKSLLDKSSLRLIVGEQELVEQWMKMIRTVLDHDKFDPNDEKRINTVTEALADAFKNTEADPDQKPYADFRKTMIERLHKLTSKEKEAQFILVANSLAAVSRKDVAEDWVWNNHDLLKSSDDFSGFLRNYICWLIQKSRTFSLPLDFHKKYPTYFCSMLNQCCNTQKDESTGWDDNAANTLVKCLYAENPLFSSHHSNLAERIICGQAIAYRKNHLNNLQ